MQHCIDARDPSTPRRRRSLVTVTISVHDLSCACHHCHRHRRATGCGLDCRLRLPRHAGDTRHEGAIRPTHNQSAHGHPDWRRQPVTHTSSGTGRSKTMLSTASSASMRFESGAFLIPKQPRVHTPMPARRSCRCSRQMVGWIRPQTLRRRPLELAQQPPSRVPQPVHPPRPELLSLQALQLPLHRRRRRW